MAKPYSGDKTEKEDESLTKAKEESEPAPPMKINSCLQPYVMARESTKRTLWDVVMFFVAAVVCIVTPLRIGFLMVDWQFWLIADIPCDLFFLVDILVTCITSYEEDGEEVSDTEKIFWRYLKSGALFLDIISILPLEVFSLATPSGEYHAAFRANRLLRLGHLVTFFSTWEKISSLKPSVIRIVKSVMVVICLAHFIGCIFHLIIQLEGEDSSDDFTGTKDIHKESLGSRYIRSFYWSFVTMTGYNNTNPTTQVETIFSILVTLMGISLFATIIGTVGSLVTNLDSSKLYFRQKMDGINDYMKYKKIPPELQTEVRNYFLYLWKSGKGLDKNKVLDDLPPYLKNKMSIFLNSDIIKKVSLFASCSDDTEFMTEIVKSLRSRICLPNSFVVRKGETGTEMYFISRGELNVIGDKNQVLTTLSDGQFFGEIALVYDSKRNASIVARTYCDMFILTKDDFKKVLKRFPQQAKEIKETARKRKEEAKADAEEKTAKEQAAEGKMDRPLTEEEQKEAERKRKEEQKKEEEEEGALSDGSNPTSAKEEPLRPPPASTNEDQPFSEASSSLLNQQETLAPVPSADSDSAVARPTTASNPLVRPSQVEEDEEL